MAINEEAFKKWAYDRFDLIKERGDELKVNSIFCDDYKQHLWINPVKNCYRCWKSDNHGNLYQLVMEVDKCSFKEAAAKIGGGQKTTENYDERIKTLFSTKYNVKVDEPNKLTLPEGCVKIDKFPDDLINLKAKQYLLSRKMPLDYFYICQYGKYVNRIVIPYYDPDNNLIYYNTRDLAFDSKLRYLGPSQEEVGIGKGDVLWFYHYPKTGSQVYLAEGEFDAMSLTLCGFNGCACGGKELTEKQIEMLRNYKITFCFDADKSGRGSLHKLGEFFMTRGLREISYVRPPVEYKDWNKFAVETDEKMVSRYIQLNEERLDAFKLDALKNAQ